VATAALVLVSITLGGLLVHATGRGQAVVYLQLPRADVGDQAHANWSSDQIDNTDFGKSAADNRADYFQLRNVILKHGVDGLPATPATNRATQPRSSLPILPLLREQLFGGES
jgi:hypothetical protein